MQLKILRLNPHIFKCFSNILHTFDRKRRRLKWESLWICFFFYQSMCDLTISDSKTIIICLYLIKTDLYFNWVWWWRRQQQRPRSQWERLRFVILLLLFFSFFKCRCRCCFRLSKWFPLYIQVVIVFYSNSNSRRSFMCFQFIFDFY